MATLYITTNADSGDGSFRALFESASAGDSIQPDPTAFPAGTPCEITLASSLRLDKSVTISGAQTRLRFVGNGAISSGVQVRAPLTWSNVDFHGVSKSGTGGFLWHYAAAGACSYTNCEFCGMQAAQGAVMYIASGASVTCTNCKFLGNCATTGSAVIHFASTNNADSTFSNCAILGNVAANDVQWNREPTLVDCVTTAENAAVPPSITYATWTYDAWRSWIFSPARYELAEAFDVAWSYYVGVDVAWLN